MHQKKENLINQAQYKISNCTKAISLQHKKMNSTRKYNQKVNKFQIMKFNKLILHHLNL
jgi:hypothetical protein